MFGRNDGEEARLHDLLATRKWTGWPRSAPTWSGGCSTRRRRRGRPATHLLTRGRNEACGCFSTEHGATARFGGCLQYLTYRVILLLLVNLLVATWLVLGGQRIGRLAASGSPGATSYQRGGRLLGAFSVASRGASSQAPFADFGFHLNAGWWA